MREEQRSRIGLARVFGALWFIIAAVIAETLLRIDQHHFFFPLLAVSAGVPGLIVALSIRSRNLDG
jgi:hypothetical protein